MIAVSKARVMTDHLTLMRESFFGQNDSKVSMSMFHCDNTAARMDRCTEDLRGACPEISEVENLIKSVSQSSKTENTNLLLEHVAQ